MTAGWDRARAIADAVLYEGYLLYPYRSTSSKNRSRWQFGVLGPPGAAAAGIGEDDTLSAQILVDGTGQLTFVVRFLQVQHRSVERDDGGGRFRPVAELTSGPQSWVTWDEAVECERPFGPFAVDALTSPIVLPVTAAAGEDVEPVRGGRLVRTRAAISADLTIRAEPDDGRYRIGVTIRNSAVAQSDRDSATAVSLIGTHVIVEVVGAEFISLLEPVDSAADSAARCDHHRCFPVLAGAPGERDLILISPIILYDHPEIAEQSDGALYDGCEIDEILTLRVMTMTDEEKAQARATDPLAARIIDRCEAMSGDTLQRMHGVLRDPHAGAGLIPEVPDGMQWWDPLADNAVRPGVDAVLVNGTRVAAGSRVRLHPTRRADAQDIFFSGKAARVVSVHEDVDGERHLGVIVEDHPDFEMPDSYGRYLYFAPDEVEPLDPLVVNTERSP